MQMFIAFLSISIVVIIGICEECKPVARKLFFIVAIIILILRWPHIIAG